MGRLPRADAIPDDVLPRAAARLDGLRPTAALDVAARFLAARGAVDGSPLAGLPVADERSPRAGALDGRLLDLLLSRALGGRRGAVFTGRAEARILAAFALARAAARRGGPDPSRGVAALLGVGRVPASIPPIMTKSAPKASAFTTSPGWRMPPSATMERSQRAQSWMAVS